MVVGEMADPADLLVVGGGPGGYAAALHAAQLGREVVLVDRDGPAGLGGTCVRVGCIPSKALIELANVYHATQRWTARGVVVTGATVDLSAFQDWKNSVVGNLNYGLQGLFRQSGVEIVAGTATFNRPNQVAVATPDGNVRFLEFKDAVVATGSRPAALATVVRDGIRVLDSTDALAMTTVPKTLVIVGSGYIGLELGMAYAKLGAKVTIVEIFDRILPNVDPIVTGSITRGCADLAIEVLTSAEVVDLDTDAVLVKTAAGERRISAEAVIVAVGRTPVTEGLGLTVAGAQLAPSGHIITDDYTLAAPRIAAIGDATTGPALAHKAMAEAEAAVRTLSGRRTRFNPLAIPAVIFSDPEVGLVGLTEHEAKSVGIAVQTAQFPMAASGRAATVGDQRGFVRMIVDRDQDAVVGVQMVGPHVSELLGEAAMAIELSASPADVASIIHPHPTISEGIAEAAALAVGRPLHVLRG